MGSARMSCAGHQCFLNYGICFDVTLAQLFRVHGAINPDDALTVRSGYYLPILYFFNLFSWAKKKKKRRHGVIKVGQQVVVFGI